MLKRAIAGCAIVFALTAIMFVASPDSAFAGTCGQTEQPRVNGGEAAWSLHCDSNTITIDGWVKDTEADGKCAAVKMIVGSTVKHSPRACPKNDKKTYTWKVNGSRIDALLYVS